MKKTIVAIWLCCCAVSFAESPDIQLRVMTFNIWYGGEQVGFGETVRVIREVNPDIVAVQEPDGNLRKLGDRTGLSYVDEKRMILSRYPLFDPDTREQRFPYTRVMVSPGQIVVFANTHLSSTPFGPDMLRDGKSVQEVLDLENQLRLPEVKPYIETLKQVVAQGTPVIFAGDFNTPPHQDWIHRKPAVEWPVTKALADAGFRDAYRTVHPDPKTRPGITYTPGYPHPYRKTNETLERIDQIWYAGKIAPLESKIVGEVNNPAVDLAFDPYPSDHRAVVTTFRATPAQAPPMIVVDTPLVRQPHDFTVRFQTPDFGDWSIFVVPPGGDFKTDSVVSAKGPTVISTRPTMKFGSMHMQDGSYDAVLVDAKSREIARSPFYVLARDAVADVRTEKATYAPGEEMHISWRNAPGMKNDWVGIYHAEDADLFTGYLGFVYTGARVEGSAVLKAPMEKGEYELRLLREDSYVMLARSKFRVE